MMNRTSYGIVSRPAFASWRLDRVSDMGASLLRLRAVSMVCMLRKDSLSWGRYGVGPLVCGVSVVGRWQLPVDGYYDASSTKSVLGASLGLRLENWCYSPTIL